MQNYDLPDLGQPRPYNKKEVKYLVCKLLKNYMILLKYIIQFGHFATEL